MKRSFIVPEIIAGLYIVLFLYTGIDKLLHAQTLQHQLVNYPLLGSLGGVVAWTLPFIEIGIALLLFFPRTKRLGLIAGTALMSVFSVYVAYMLAFDDRHPCTCGGFLTQLSWPQHLAFNLLYVLMGLIALKMMRSNKNMKPPSENRIVYT